MSWIKLSTGKMLEPHRGIVGLDEDGRVFEGYDGEFVTPDQAIERCWGEGEGDVLTPAECVELADIMIARWTSLKQRYAGG